MTDSYLCETVTVVSSCLGVCADTRLTGSLMHVQASGTKTDSYLCEIVALTILSFGVKVHADTHSIQSDWQCDACSSKWH